MKRSAIAFIGAVTIALTALPAGAGVILSQDFSSSTNVGDYVSTPGDATHFDGIGVTADATVSVGIDSGTLQYSVVPDGVLPQGYGGFLWVGKTSGTYDVMALQMAMTVDTGGFSNGNTEIQIVLGGFTGPNVYDWSVQSNGTDTAKAYVIMQGADYQVTSGGFTTTVTSGASAQIGFYANHSGDTVSFLGDDGLTHSLSNDGKSLFVNGILVMDNAAVDKVGVLQGLRVTVNTRTGQNVDDGVFQFDNLVLSDSLPIPEPASMSLLTLGAAALLKRHNASRQ